MQYRTVVKNYVVRDRHFVIVQDENGWYLAVEDRYIGDDGKLIQALNGFNTHANKNLDACLTNTRDYVEADYLVGQGYTKAEALAKVFGLEDKLDELKAMFD